MVHFGQPRHTTLGSLNVMVAPKQVNDGTGSGAPLLTEVTREAPSI